ncbi:MAG: hypothetical protein Crog4KO_11330 [Crocinitomicaceae bacterium]
MKLFASQLLACLLMAFSANAQLNVGDIAFVGYNTDGSDDFSWIALADIPGGEVIYFSEEGWDLGANTWAGTTEGHMTYTAPGGGISCGTVVHIDETAANVFTVTGGGSAVLSTGASWSLSAGDQVLAYQAASPEPATVPTFISGVHGDDGNGSPLSLDATTGWNNAAALPLGNARSQLPPGLTNGTDCVSLFPAVGTESDNARYGGTLTGTAAALRASINDRTNWASDNTTPFNITPGSYTTAVTCSGLPVELSVFEVTEEKRDVFLDWTTESEFDNSGFDIMHSVDGVEWTKIGFVHGMGTTTERTNYNYSDRSVTSGNHYYQLIQKDWNGLSEASPIRSVSVGNKLNSTMLLFPNPSTGNFARIEAKDHVATITVMDAFGRLVEVEFDAQDQRINTMDLVGGVYTILGNTKNGEQYRAVLVKGK